jgi:hypothetical protein
MKCWGDSQNASLKHRVGQLANERKKELFCTRKALHVGSCFVLFASKQPEKLT